MLATITWDGGTNGAGTNWNTAANWVGDVLPGSGDDAQIGTGFTGITYATDTRTIRSLTTSSDVMISSGSLTITDNSTFDAAVNVTGTGTLKLDSMTLAGTGDLINAESLILVDSTVSTDLINQGTLEARGTSVIDRPFSSAANSTLRVLIKSFVPGQLTILDGFTNNGLIELTDDGTGDNRSANLNVTNGTLINAATGTIRSAAGAGGRSLNAQLDNQGMVDVDRSLSLTNGSRIFKSSQGAIDVAGGTTLTINSGTTELGSGSVLSGSGTIDLAGTAALTLTSNLTLTASRLSLSGTVVVNGTAGTEQLINQGTLILSDDAVHVALVNQGTLEVRGTSVIDRPFSSAANSTLRVLIKSFVPGQLTILDGFTNNGLIELTDDGTGDNRSANLNVTNGTLINAATGAIRAAAGAGGRTLNAQLDNQGIVDVDRSLSVTNGSHIFKSSQGTIDVAGGTTLTINSGTTELGNGSVLSGSGTIDLAGTAALTLTSNLTLTASRLSLSGTVVVNGTAGTEQLINQGTLILSDDAVHVALVNQGTLEARGTSIIDRSFSSAANSTLRVLIRSFISGQLTILDGFTNNGLIELTDDGTGDNRSATLNVTNGTLINAATGTIRSAAGAGGRALNSQLDNQGIITVDAALTINKASADHSNSGTINVSGGTLTVTQSGTTPTFANTATGTSNISSGRTLNISGGVFGNVSGGTLTGGIYNITGTLKFDGAAITTNAASIVLDGTGSQIVNQSNANALTNLAANTATGILTLQNGRSLSTAGAFTNAGSVTIGSGSTLATGASTNFVQTAGATVLSTATSALDPGGIADIRGGSLSGVGTILGNVQNAGELSPGNSPGILSITGDYTQTTDGKLNIEIGGTTASPAQFDQLNITGAAAFAGTLNVVTSFTPREPNTFRIATFGSSSGNFTATTGLQISPTQIYQPVFDATDLTLHVHGAPTIAWDGGPSGLGTNWNNAVNWVYDILPGAGDHASIDAAFADTTITVSSNVSILSVNSAANLSVSNSVLSIAEPSSVFGSLTVQSGGVLTHSQGVLSGLSLAVTGLLDVQTGGTIDVSGKGYRGGRRDGNPSSTAETRGTDGVATTFGGSSSGGGGSYGSLGGIGGGTRNSVYGSATNPVDLGSGGGVDSGNYQGGNGGGRIALTVGSLQVNGDVLANGTSAAFGNSGSGGGGSGGTIAVTVTGAGTFSGTGTISASGGSPAGEGGVGGGGRIAITGFGTNTFTQGLTPQGQSRDVFGNAFAGAATTYLADAAGSRQLTLNGATHAVSTGSVESFARLIFVGSGSSFNNAGTLSLTSLEVPTGTSSASFWNQTAASLSLANNTLTIANGLTFLEDGDLHGTGQPTDTIGSLTVQSGGVLTHSQGVLSGLSLSVTGLLDVQAGGMIDVSGKGYRGGRRDGNPSSTAETRGTDGVATTFGGSSSGCGGSYGSLGGIGGGSRNSVYGSATNPVDLGSGGGVDSGNYQGGNGGGRIALTVGSLQVNGDVLANGTSAAFGNSGSGGGGSGGTIAVTVTGAGTFSGTGTISASGGSPAGEGGVGGGGRIAINGFGEQTFDPPRILAGGGTLSSQPNQPPSITGVNSNTQAVDDNATLNPFDTVTLSDSDSTGVTVMVAYTAANGEFVNLGGFTGSPGDYRFTGDIAAAQTALRGLVFDPTDNQVAPGSTVNTQLTVGITDGRATPVTDSQTTVVATAFSIPAPPAIERRFDFNHQNSPTQSPVRSDANPGGYIGVTKNDVYTAQRGYGWSATVNSEDVSRLATTNGALRRDVHLGTQGPTGARSFRADIPAGDYLVNLTLGHPVAAMQGVNVQIEGIPVLSGFSTQAGQFLVEGANVTVTDGVLDVTIMSANIGSNWSIAGLEILPQSSVANAVTFTTFTPQGGTVTSIPPLVTVTADGTSVDSVSGTVSAALANTLLTVRTTLGTITTADADSSLQGVQITASGTSFSFNLRRPIAAGTPTISAAAVNGGIASSSEVVTYELTAGAAEFFDFGTPRSPAQDGYTQVYQYDAYTAMRGYGWVGASLGAVDRGARTASSFSNLLRDGNLATSARTFRVDVAAGSYDVTLTIGDSTAITDLDVTLVTGTVVSGLGNVTNVMTGGNRYTHRTVRVASAAADGGQHAIAVSITSTGTPWVLTALTVRPAAVVDANGLTIAAPGGSLTADGNSLDTFTVTGTDIGKLYTISTTPGTVVAVDGDSTPDQDPFYEGVQVAGTSAGMVVRVRRPTVPGTATFSVSEVSGAEHGTASQAYVLPPVRRFDFGTTTSPVANGFTQIKQSTTFTTALGYGWLSNPNTYNRGGAVGVTVPDLYRDGVLVGLATFRVSATLGGLYDLQVYTGDSLSNGNRLRVSVENNAFVATSNLLSLNQYETLVLQDIQDMNGDGFLTIAFTKGTPSSGLGFVLGFDIATDGNLPTPTTLAASETGSGGASIDLGTVQSLVSAAIERWSNAGLSRSAVDHLRTIEFRVQDLSGSLLGVADDNVIIIDSNAAGHGWFIDDTPLDDAEFGSDLTASSGPARGCIDLLTVLMHELGHTLGVDHEHSGDDLMSALLGTGQRRLANVDDIFAANDVWDDIN